MNGLFSPEPKLQKRSGCPGEQPWYEMQVCPFMGGVGGVIAVQGYSSLGNIGIEALTGFLSEIGRAHV